MLAWRIPWTRVHGAQSWTRGKGEWKPTPLRIGGQQGKAGSTHLSPEDTTVQSAGSLVVEKVKLQHAQCGWRKREELT